MGERDQIYTETIGTTVVLVDADGNTLRGTVTGLIRHRHPVQIEEWRTEGAFVSLDGPTGPDGQFLCPGPMLHVTLGQATGDRGQRHEVTRWRVVDRDEFDRLNDIHTLRRDLGWRS